MEQLPSRGLTDYRMEGAEQGMVRLLKRADSEEGDNLATALSRAFGADQHLLSETMRMVTRDGKIRAGKLVLKV